MTSKDAVKCRLFADSRMWELPVAARVEPDAGRAIVEHVMGLLPGRGAVLANRAVAPHGAATAQATRTGADPAPH